MYRPALALAMVSLVCAGCIGVAPDASRTGTVTATDTGTATPSAHSTRPENVSVEYVVGAGEIPDELRSVTVTLRVVFVEEAADLGPCWSETFHGPYKPTPTPIPPPSGDCHRSKRVSVDLTEIDDGRSLGQFAAPGSFSAGHGLVVTAVTATYRNGTSTTAIKGTGGHVASVVEGRPDGSYRVVLDVDPGPPEAGYEYELVSEPGEASEASN